MKKKLNKKVLPQGKKLNKDKPKICLVPEEAILGAAIVFTQALDTHEPYNYRKGLFWTDLTDSLDRHMLKFKAGQEFDEDTGLPQIWHILANASMLEYMRVHHPELDNRDTSRKEHKHLSAKVPNKPKKKK